MLTAEENDLLCRVEGDCAHGPPDARALDTRSACRRKWPSRTARRCARGCSARTSSCSAIPTGGSASSASTVRIGARRSRSAATRNADCAASITAGRSTSTATSSRCRRSLRQAGSRQKVKHTAYPAAKAGGFVWVWMGAGAAPPIRAARRGRPSPTTKVSIVKMLVNAQLGADPRGRDRLGAQLDAAFDRHAARARRRRAARRRPFGRARRPTRRRGCSRAADRVRLPLRRDPPADQQRRHARLHAHHAVRRAVHRADPAEQPVQPGDPQHSESTTRTRCSTSSRGATETTAASTRRRGASSAARRSASTSTRSSAPCAIATTATCRTGRR